MPSPCQRLWQADYLSREAKTRLQPLYSGTPAALAARARTLRTAVTAAFLRTTLPEPALFVFVPCTSYDDGLSFDALPQVIDAVGRNVFPVLVLPDGTARQVAAQRAARDNLSRLVYFLDAQTTDLAHVLAGAGPFGSVLILQAPGRIEAPQLAAIVANVAHSPLLDVAADAAYVHCRQVSAGQLEATLSGAAASSIDVGSSMPVEAPGPIESNGFMMSSGETGEIISASHGWLDSLDEFIRPDPILLAGRQPARRVWFDLPGRTEIGKGPAATVPARLHLDASRVTCYTNHSGPGNDLVVGFALGHGCRLAHAEEHSYEDSQGTSLVWGVLRGSDQVVAAAVENGRSFIYCDHAYFNRGHLKNYRVILNAHATTALRDCPDDRTSALGVVLKPWRTQGRHVLVCPPTDHFLRAHGSPNWIANTLSSLRRHTDRPIVVRNKPRPGSVSPSLEEDLQDCHAVVAHSSNAAVEAVVLGVPVFVSPSCAAIGVGRSELSLIEQPAMPDRRLWLANLAYSQFTFDEVLQGRVLGLMARYWEMELAA